MRPSGPDTPWLALRGGEEERADAERCVLLEWQAAITFDPAEATRLLAEADEIRERWDHPRRRVPSLAEIIDELAAIVAEVREVDIGDYEALEDLGYRASSAGCDLDTFAEELREVDRPAEDTGAS